jgi:hypothetical protein
VYKNGFAGPKMASQAHNIETEIRDKGEVPTYPWEGKHTYRRGIYTPRLQEASKQLTSSHKFGFKVITHAHEIKSGNHLETKFGADSELRKVLNDRGIQSAAIQSRKTLLSLAKQTSGVLATVPTPIPHIQMIPHKACLLSAKVFVSCKQDGRCCKGNMCSACSVQ